MQLNRKKSVILVGTLLGLVLIYLLGVPWLVAWSVQQVWAGGFSSNAEWVNFVAEPAGRLAEKFPAYEEYWMFCFNKLFGYSIF